MVIWSKPARDDLKNIYSYIHLDSPTLAKKVTDSIVKNVFRLNDFPQMGHIVPEKNNAVFRELLIYSYRIIYAVRDNDIFIVAILHSKRDFFMSYDDVSGNDIVSG